MMEGDENKKKYLLHLDLKNASFDLDESMGSNRGSNHKIMPVFKSIQPLTYDNKHIRIHSKPSFNQL